MTCKANRYVRAVERHLEKLRSHMLFMDTRFESLLPPGMKGDAGEKAKWITDRLMHSLALAAEIIPEPAEITETRAWLYGIIYYLLDQCLEGDWTVANIKMLAERPQETRMYIFPAEAIYFSLRTRMDIPRLLKKLERAMLYIKGEAALESRAALNGVIL